MRRNAQHRAVCTCVRVSAIVCRHRRRVRGDVTVWVASHGVGVCACVQARLVSGALWLFSWVRAAELDGQVGGVGVAVRGRSFGRYMWPTVRVTDGRAAVI